MTTVDARGLACPEPVMLTIDALKKNGLPVTVLVSDKIACNNVTKQGKKKGTNVTVKEIEDGYEIVIE